MSMGFRGKSIHSLVEADVRALVEAEVSEDRTLDYKRALPDRTARRDLLGDVVAFANAAGGHLLYGVTEGDGETEGIAVDVPGVEVASLDAEIRRLTDLIRDGTDPPVPNVDIAAVPLVGGRYVIVIEVPQSFARPHMISLAGSNPFYLRRPRSSTPMTIDEIRAAFNLAGSIVERIRAFRRERLEMIERGEGSFRVLDDVPRHVLHVLPLGMFDPSHVQVTLTLDSARSKLPILGRETDYDGVRFNFDGIAHYSPKRGPTTGYTQLFRSGAIEAVTADFATPLNGEAVRVKTRLAEGFVIRGLQRYLGTLVTAGVPPPFVVGLSILSRVPFSIFSPQVTWPGASAPLGSWLIRSARLIVPEVVIGKYPEIGHPPGSPADEAATVAAARTVSDAMRPAFDTIWNAGGLPHSPSYDDEGRWRGPGS